MKQHVLEALAAKSAGDLSLVFTARKGGAGCSPWEFAFGAGGVWVLAVVRLLFRWQRVGDARSDTSGFVPGAALSQQSLAAPRQRREIYMEQKAVKGCVFIRGGREA